jgi:catechol 2,3-dioxygenase
MAAKSPSSEPTMANRTPLRIGAYALAVRDLEGVAAFYRRIVGLEVIARKAGEIRLGVPGVTLLHLEHRPEAEPDDPKAAGLFHTAFLMPTRADLADWYLHAQRCGLTVTRTGDHDVNEAIYYDDPEGNGCECYADRPPHLWRWADDGTIDIPSSPVDLDSLVRDARGDASTWQPPAGLRIGHINLRVGAVPPSEKFLCGVIGLDHTGRRDVPALGGTITFMSSGRYHHHMATNDFLSRGAGRRDPARSGLSWLAIEADNDAVLNPVRARLAAAGLRLDPVDRGFETEDPWGTRIRFVTA